MPDSLEKLNTQGLARLTWLPKLPTRSLRQLRISTTAISVLPGSLPRLAQLWCNVTPIQRLPLLPSCKELCVAGCMQLRQLPEQLPASLTLLDCSECRALDRLPAQLPPKLGYLNASYCTALKQLPQLPPALKTLNCEACSSLQQLPDLSKFRVKHIFAKGCVAVKSVRMGGCMLHLK